MLLCTNVQVIRATSFLQQQLTIAKSRKQTIISKITKTINIKTAKFPHGSHLHYNNI